MVGRGFGPEEIDRAGLEQLVAAELEAALQEVPRNRGTKSSGESACSFARDHLSKTADNAAIVDQGVELDPCLDTKGDVSTVDMGRTEKDNDSPARRVVNADDSASFLGRNLTARLHVDRR